MPIWVLAHRDELGLVPAHVELRATELARLAENEPDLVIELAAGLEREPHGVTNLRQVEARSAFFGRGELGEPVRARSDGDVEVPARRATGHEHLARA
jgi:hypothetical protein